MNEELQIQVLWHRVIGLVATLVCAAFALAHFGIIRSVLVGVRNSAVAASQAIKQAPPEAIVGGAVPLALLVLVLLLCGGVQLVTQIRRRGGIP